MPASDVLKTLRGNGYGKTSDPKPDDGMDSGEENETPRLIKFTDDEQKAFAQAKPGEDLVCEVHGSLDGEGMFRVMSIGPMNGGNDEMAMAGQVAQKVQPNIAPSPS